LKKIIFHIINLLFLSTLVSAQGGLNISKDFNGCEKLIKKGKYQKAKECYETLLPLAPNNTKLLVRLAEVCYRLDIEDSCMIFIERAVQMNAEEAYHPLSFLSQQMSFKNDNKLAVFVLDQLGQNLSDQKMKSQIRARTNSYLLKKYAIDQPTYNVQFENMGDSINSTESEYLPSFSLDGNKILFTRRVSGANEDFFVSLKDSLGRFAKAKNLGYPPNTSMPEGAAMLSADGNYIFFTRCDMRSSNGMEGGGCDLVFCYRENGEWSPPQYFQFTINTTAFEGQPCLSSNNRDLYFVSDRPGGYGGKDIYVSHFRNNLWSMPENLGPIINTSGDETSPYIHPDNETLYFGSTGHPGFGSIDLFMSRKNKNRTWKPVVNLGKPINSAGFDGSIYVDTEGEFGYISAERGDSRGLSDIYKFKMYSGIRPLPTLCIQGRLKDKKDSYLIKDYPIKFYKYNGSLTPLANVSSNSGDASFTRALHKGKQYYIAIEKNGYRPFYKIIDLRKDTFDTNYLFDIRLKRPHLLDTLYRTKLNLDTANSIELSASEQKRLDSLMESWDYFTRDSAMVNINLKTYYYVGDSDTDSLAQIYFDQAMQRLWKMKRYFIRKGIPCHKINDRMDPYLKKEDDEKYGVVELEFVEYY